MTATPVTSNTGVNRHPTTPPTPKHPLAHCRLSLSIDAVTATVRTNVQTLTNTLEAALGATAHPCRPLRGMGYTHAAELLTGDALGRRAVVQYGTAHEHPNVVAEGTSTFDAPALYEALCANFAGDWYPSRLDPALDFHDDAAFDVLARLLLDFAKARGIKIDQRGDWERGTGRTLYLYSRESQFFVRLYEYRAHHGYGPPCRLEVEIKLKGQDKRARLASMTPWDMLRSCPASHHVLTTIGVDLAPLKVSEGPRPPTTIERDLAFLSSTAFPALLRLVAHHGGVLDAALSAVFAYRDETARIRALITGEAKGYTSANMTPNATTALTDSGKPDQAFGDSEQPYRG